LSVGSNQTLLRARSSSTMCRTLSVPAVPFTRDAVSF
jgi:hypothetical protein